MIIRTLGVLALLLMTGAWTANAATLRSRVTVQDDMIRVSDLFDGAGAAANKIVDQAPTPGVRRIFDLRGLRDIARRHGLDWTPTNGHVRVVVDRAARLIGRAELERALERSLRRSGAGGHLGVTLVDLRRRVRASLNRKDAFRFEDIHLDARSGRVTATLVVPTGPDRANRISVHGRAEPVVELPVPTRRIARGDVIERGDVTWRRLHKARVRGNVIRDSKGLVGLAARHALRPGQPVRESDVRPPVIVSRGALVTLMLRTGRMILTTKGKALQDGALGQTIRVVNSRSKRIIEGVVDSAGRVRIPGTVDPALRSDAAAPRRGERS